MNYKDSIKIYQNQIELAKTELEYVNHNYDNILLNYDNIEIEQSLRTFKNFTKKLIFNWNSTKSNFFNKLSTIKPTIYKNTEVTSITDFVDLDTSKEHNPKKIEIIFPDGSIVMYYKIISYQHVKW